MASRMLRSTSLTCHDLQKVLGVLASLIAAVPLIRLRSRYLQRDLNLVYTSPWDSKLLVVLSSEALWDLHWIVSLELPQCVAPMWPILVGQCDVEVSTDASDIGWGIHHDGRLLRGLWSDRLDPPEHINAKELTVLIFLEEFLPASMAPRNLLWRTDSTTAMSYVIRQGGTQSLSLLRLATAILPFAHAQEISILPVFVPLEENLPDWRL